ncbi:Topless-related protein 3 [Bienertia sinuspersici]
MSKKKKKKHFTLILSGKWDKVERYLCGYGSLKDDKLLSKVHFEVMKQKLFEALDIGNHAKALEIVNNELKVFASYDEELIKGITQFQTFDNFREHKFPRNYGDVHYARSKLSKELRKIIEEDPGFRRKVDLNWQHLRCKNPELIFDVETLFEDHICQPNEQFIERNLEPIYRSICLEATAYSAMTSATVKDGSETDLTMDSEEEVQPCSRDSPESKLNDLPVTVNCILDEASNPTTMDFHPNDNSILLVGTDNGDVSLWDIALRRKLISRSFNVWYTGEYSPKFKEAFTNDLHIDAHEGSVNDIAFSKPDKETYAITCGDDKMVKLIFSTSTNGELRGWMYDNLKHRIAVDDPCCRRMICSKDGKRFFSCGITEEEKSCILEWDIESNSVKQTYQRLQKPCPGVVHFDTAENVILVAGDNHQIKFWDMRNCELISYTDTGENLPVYPYIRFNKDGALLAVSATENRIRDDASRLGVVPNSIGEDNICYEPLLLDTYPGFSIRRLSADVNVGKICRLTYTNASNSILALTWSGTHLVWRWSESDTSSMKISTFIPSLPQTTAVAIYPNDNNVIAIGRSDATILIYDIHFGEIISKLEGHSRQIIDLAFSTMDILISSGADSKICVWYAENWEMKASTYLDGLSGARILFHQDQVHFLVIHDTVLAIYEAHKLQCSNQWFVGQNRSSISCAAFSCDGKMIYAGFSDATLSIFDASNFELRSCISLRYQFSTVNIHPTAIAAHPKKPYQFVLGLSDGTVAIFEYLEPNCRLTISP